MSERKATVELDETELQIVQVALRRSQPFADIPELRPTLIHLEKRLADVADDLLAAYYTEES